MGTIKHTPFRKITGTIDNYVFYVREGKQCVRRRPRPQQVPYTPAQQAQQERIASVAVFYHSLKQAGLYAFWQKAAERTPRTGYNLLVSQNAPVFDGEGRISDFTKLRLTPELLSLPNNMALEAGGADEWILTWKPASWRTNSRHDDRLAVVLMKDMESYNIKIVDIGEVYREECRAVVRIPGTCRDYAHLFCFFYSQATGKSSGSKYFKFTNF